MLHISVAMATDNRCIPLIVSLTSLLKSAEKTVFYDIYILVDDLFTVESEETVIQNLRIFENQCTVSFINVGNAFDQASAFIPHITRPTFFRLMIPELLREDKCVYLDTDTIIMSDLQGIMDIPLGENYVAGVWHPGVILDAWEGRICQNAKIPKADQYINAGVLVMNLEMMRRDRLVEKFMELIPENMPMQDQDILNHVCYGKIAFLPFKYNVMTKYAEKCIEDYEECYSRAELEEAWNRPCVIHYASSDKPWNSADCVFMEQWWKYFMKTPLYEASVEEFFEDFVTGSIYGAAGATGIRKKMPALYQWKGKKYVIYGAGKRARDVILYMKRYDMAPEFAVVSELSEDLTEIEKIPVRDIRDQNVKLDDKTIILAVGQNLQREIITNLQKYEWYELLPIADGFAAF